MKGHRHVMSSFNKLPHQIAILNMKLRPDLHDLFFKIESERNV